MREENERAARIEAGISAHGGQEDGGSEEDSDDEDEDGEHMMVRCLLLQASGERERERASEEVEGGRERLSERERERKSEGGREEEKEGWREGAFLDC